VGRPYAFPDPDEAWWIAAASGESGHLERASSATVDNKHITVHRQPPSTRMAASSNAEWIVPTTDARSLPVVEILTGRGFVSGKSGSGKSNTVGVICEELLDNGYNFLIVDTEGEYYGLQEQYQLLHVGGDEFADVRVGPDHAEKLAEIGLERNVPIILDVSGFDDVDESRELITRTIEELYRLEKDVRKPFLLIVEEMQEYLPQQGGSDELGEILERVSKRGRKRGLGMCGISQRPSSVDKDFITQCDWMAWHRLTWEADVKVVSKIIGSEKKDALTDLDAGEAFLMTDWDEAIERVQFRRKRTHDAGATPGLESYDRPDLKTVGTDLIAEIEGSEQTQAEADAAAAADQPEPEAGSLDDLDLPENGADAADPPGSPMDQSPADGERGSGGAVDGDAVADLDDDAVPEELERVRQRNQVLEREVEELRTLLQSVDPDHEGAADHASQPEFAATGAGESGSGGSGGGSESVASPEPTVPTRPTAPSRPANRSGVGGAFLEFGEMLIYLLKSVSYRFRLLSFKIRR